MSTYEELSIILGVAMLIVTILIYINSKTVQKNNHPPTKQWVIIFHNFFVWKPLCGADYLLYLYINSSFYYCQERKQIMSEAEINAIIASNINRYLNSLGKSQLDLAIHMGVSQATVSNWCKGVKMPRMDKIDRICEYLHCYRSDLIEKIVQHQV